MESQPKNGTWAWIWKLRVPHKIQLFIWKCAHHRIPTKSILFSHSANFSQLCPGCHETKTPMHVLRDCAFAKNIWLSYGQSSLVPDFFTLPLQHWCKANLFISCLSSYIPWSTIFAFTIWAIWLGRNSFIFYGRFIAQKFGSEMLFHMQPNFFSLVQFLVYHQDCIRRWQSDGYLHRNPISP